MHKVGVIIPFYIGNKYLKLLLDSILEAADSCDIRVFVIDNSRNGERVNRGLISNPNVYVIDAGTGIGYGKACNIGYRLCVQHMVDIVVIANQDGYFASGSLDLMVNILLKEDDYSVAVPLLARYESDDVEWFFTHVYLTPMEELVSDLFRGKVKSFYPIHQLCGACFAFKLKDYHGFDYLFDDLYHMYFEDGDLYKRIERLNKKVMLIPGAIFHHTHGNTTNWEKESMNDKVTRRASRLIYNLKHDKRSIMTQLPGWFLLEFRVIIEYLITLRWKMLGAEFIGFIKVISQLPEINRKRSLERKVFNN